MITAIEIENFKAFRERVRVELKPLTLIFGPNSAGKSTIIQALHCAREIFEHHNLDPDRTVSGGDAFDLGGFTNIVYGHDLGRTMQFRFNLDLTSRALPDYHDESLGQFEDMDGADEIETMLARCRSASVRVDVQWNREKQLPSVIRYRVGLNGRRLARTGVPGEPIELEGKKYAFAVVDVDFAHPLLNEAGFASSSPRASRLSAASRVIASARLDLKGKVPSALPRWGKVLDLEDADELFAEEADAVGVQEPWERNWVTSVALTSMIVGPGQLVRDDLRSLRYLGPIREMPLRNYVPSSRPDKQRWATGLGAWDKLHESEQGFIDRVNHWMSRLKCGYTLRLKSYREVDERVIPQREAPEGEWKRFREGVEKQPPKTRVVLVPDGQSIEVLPNDVGIGVSQLLPAVVLVLDAEDGIVAIEQPEIHLHPALQAELGDLFIGAALGDRGNRKGSKTLIIETHSEHLILRVMRRMRDTVREKHGDAPGVGPEDVAVLFVEPTPNGSAVHQLRLAPDGSLLDPWPGGFFEESFGELFS